MEELVKVTMTKRQAAILAKWLGDHYMVDLPEDGCREIHAMSVALKRGESIDVSGFSAEVKP